MASDTKRSGPERTRGQRAGLDLQQIVDAAKTIALDKLSMQSVADALQVDRKALHYYVKDRQALLQWVARDAFAERLSGREIASQADWRAACRRFATQLVERIVSLGELAEYLWFGDRLTFMSLEPAEALFAQLQTAAFSDEDAVRLVVLLASIALAHARDVVQAGQGEERPRRRFLREALQAPGAPPLENLNRILGAGVDTYGASQLDFDLEIFLAGAQRWLDGSDPKAS